MTRREGTGSEKNGPSTKLHWFVLGLAALTCGVYVGSHHEPQAQPRAQAQHESQTQTPVGTAGMRILAPGVTKEQAAAETVAYDSPTSTSSQGLYEVAQPGGGAMVHLQGRFQSATIVTVDANGKTVVECGGSSHGHGSDREER